MCIYMYMYTHTIYSTCRMLLVYVFSGLTFGIGKPVGVHFPGKANSPPDQRSLVSCRSLCRVKVSQTFPCPLWHVCMSSACLGSHVVETL